MVSLVCPRRPRPETGLVVKRTEQCLRMQMHAFTISESNTEKCILSLKSHGRLRHQGRAGENVACRLSGSARISNQALQVKDGIGNRLYGTGNGTGSLRVHWLMVEHDAHRCATQRCIGSRLVSGSGMPAATWGILAWQCRTFPLTWRQRSVDVRRPVHTP